MRTLPNRLLHYAMMLMVVFGLYGCNSPYEITDPANGSVFNAVPPTFKIKYASQPETSPMIVLNGISVGSFFTFGATEATATGGDLSLYLVQGKNTFQVDPPFGPKSEFTYETTGPAVVVTQASGTDVKDVSGVLVDTTGASELSVNGVLANLLPGGLFNVQVPAADIYTFYAKDNQNNVNYTQYAKLGQKFNPILGMRINQSGFDNVLPNLGNMIAAIDLNALMANTVIYDTTWKGPSGETYGADGTLNSLEMGMADNFKLTLGNGGDVAFSGTITNVHAVLTLRLHNGLLPPTVINIGAQIGPIDLAGTINMKVTNEVPVISMNSFSLNIGAIALDNTPAIFNSIISGITAGMTNLIVNSMSGVISNAVTSMLAGSLSQMLVDSYTIPLYGRELKVGLKPAKLSTDNGSLLIAMSGNIAPGAADPLVAQPLGALYTADALPDPTIAVGDFAMGINTNFINQMLASVHSAGLTQINTVTLKAENDKKVNQFGLPHDDSIGAEGDTRTLIEMGAAPQMKVSRADSGDPITKIYLHGLKMQGDKKVNGAWAKAYSVRLNVVADAKLSVTADNKMAITVSSVPRIEITGIAVGNGPELPGVVNNEINQFAQIGVGFVLEQMTTPLTNLKLPEMMCLTVDFKKTTASGEHGTHLDLAGLLSKSSNACDTTPLAPPKISYGRGAGVPLVCASNEDLDAGLCYDRCQGGYDGVGPVCWKQEASYERGVGTVPGSTCGAGKEMDAGLCYPVCNTGYHGVGPVCWNDQPESYGRGAGTIPTNIINHTCPSGKEYQDGLCYTICNSGYHGVGPVCWNNQAASYGRGAGTVPQQVCGSNEDLDAGLCYPKCNTGYHGVGPVCWTNDAVSYGRGVGRPVHVCPAGLEQDAALCYPKCAPGYHAEGPVCWPDE